MLQFLAQFAAPEAHNWRKLWSVQLTIFWGTMQGIYVFLPALQEYVSPIHFLEICIGVSVLIGLARLTNQPGLS